MTREQLYEFIVLSQTLNYSKAARQLYISQATLSRHIMELEKELGVQLFHRSTHMVTLTAAGELFKKDAANLVVKHDESLNRLRFSSISTSGTCSILCSKGTLSPYLLHFFDQFQKKYNEIVLSIDVLPDDQIEEKLGKYHIVFSLFEYPHRDHIKAYELLHYDSCMILPMEESFHSPYEIRLNELTGKNLILPYTDILTGPFARICQLAKRHTYNQITIIPAANIDTALLNVSLGYGVTILPKPLDGSIYSNSRVMHISNANLKFTVFMYYNLAQEEKASNLLCSELVHSGALYHI